MDIFSNKRTELFSSYIDYLHQIILKDLIRKKNFKEILAIGFSKNEINQLNENLKIKTTCLDELKYTNKTKFSIWKLNFFYISFLSFIYLLFIKIIFNKNSRQ